MKLCYIAALLAFVAPCLVAQVPRTISYQGVLLDAAGNPIPDGQHTIVVELFDVQTGGTALFSETQNCATKNGVFNFIIGSLTPIPSAVLFDRPYFLSTAVDGGSALSPRVAFTAVPFAFRAEYAATAGALAPGASGAVTSVNGAEGALTFQGGGGTTITRNGNTITVTSTGGSATGITGLQNTDGTISIANPNGPVATVGIADNGVTTTKLADASVGASKLAGNCVGTVNLVSDAVTTEKIADGAVSTPKIADGAVSGEKLAYHAVNSTNIMMNAVTTTEIADQAVSGPKIATEAVTTDKISAAGAAADNVLSFDGTNVVWRPAQITLPFSDTVDAPTSGFSIRHNSSHAIVAVAPPGMIGILGKSNDVGVIGMNAGVSGASNTGSGVVGFTKSGEAIKGMAESGNAGLFYIMENTSTKSAVDVSTAGSGPGLSAYSESGYGVSTMSISGVAMRAIGGGTNLIEAYSNPNVPNLRFRVLATGDVRCDGAFTGGGADLAEAFDVEGNKTEYEPGDVLVISPGSDYKVMKSSEPNSTAVAGVYATKPGVLLAPTNAETEIGSLVPLGMVGVIPTKVCAENGPIHRGDLLVTSSTPGHAMKAVPAMVGGVAIYPTGAILGKALENFDGAGTGMIKVLVNVK